ncbi:protein penguin [Cephus cinctus]|uniref:Protein penguin n=1 Tax=Cephus cinctus TaxID=211228 RepID=A0AAJ7C419_CEPCN|nr:protein penguin [Cephus cinctus]XP_015601355.1 protein penguin [Cephus cinctus]XP_024943752.1 protein penguin [Cephus cinctus]
MKQKNKDYDNSEPKAKKLKKSVSFSAVVDVDEVQQKIPKKAKLIKSNVDDNSHVKRGKFEKPVAGKKTEKPNKFNRPEKSAKPNVVRGKGGPQLSSKTGTTEKPDWLTFKKEKKELKEKRKAKRLCKVYDVTVQVKKIGEKLRRSDCSAEERLKLSTELHDLLKGHYKKMIFTHDISRLVQWIFKYGKPDIKESIILELKPCIVSMLQSKYAKNCIKIALKHGTSEIRSLILLSFYGNVMNLVNHSISAPIMEYAYSTWATELQKLHFKQEFYGDMYKQAKDDKVKKLTDVFKSAADMKSATLTAVKRNLIKILNKKLINSTLVHIVLWEFLSNSNVEDRNELIVMLRSLVLQLSESKEGTKAAIMCIWHSSNKDRKIVMKSLKEHIKDVANSEHGHLILLAFFDCVDDTVLMKKMLLTEIQSNLTEIALNEYGKRVILYLVARRDSHYFHPADIEYLKQGDNNATSKKPAELRENELLLAVIDKFLESVSTETSVWLSNGSISMVALAILKRGSGENLKTAFEAVAKFIANLESKIVENEVEYKAIEHSGLHMMLKKLIQNDKNNIEKGEPTFGEALIELLDTNIIKQWIEFNRACFLLITLIETETKPLVTSLINKLQPLTEILKSKKSPGASILLKKIK